MGRFILIIPLVVFVGLATLGILAWKVAESRRIVTFETCRERYPVVKTNPPQCRTPDGRVYVGPTG